MDLIMSAQITGGLERLTQRDLFKSCIIFGSSAPSILVHLWRYRGGYPALTEVMNKLRQNKVTGARISLPAVCDL